jgi:hypothetical protein
MGISVQILTDEVSNSYRLARLCLGAAETISAGKSRLPLITGFSGLIPLRRSRSTDESGIMEIRLSGKCDVVRGKNSPFFGIPRVFVRLDHVTRSIVNANHSIM